MNGYQYPSRTYQENGPTMMEDMGVHAMDTFDMDGQSLDQIVSQNDHAEDLRRRSIPVYPHRQTQQTQQTQQIHMNSPDNSRLSMLHFGDPSDAGDFQFDMQAAGMGNMMHANPSFPRTSGEMRSGRNPADLAINTQFQSQNSTYSAMPAPGSAYASPMHRNASLELNMSPYQNSMNMAMDLEDPLNMMSADMNMFQNLHFTGSMLDSAATQELIGPKPAPAQDSKITSLQSQDQLKRSSMSNTPEARPSGQPSRTGSHENSSARSSSRAQSEQHSSAKTSVPTQMSLTSLKKQLPIAQDPSMELPKEIMTQAQNFKQAWSLPNSGYPSRMHSNPNAKSNFKNAYSSTGFDMLGILVRFIAGLRADGADNSRCEWLRGLTPRSTLAP
jgi:hypothetical protein